MGVCLMTAMRLFSYSTLFIPSLCVWNSFLMRNIDGGTLMQNPDVKAEDKLRNIVTFMMDHGSTKTPPATSLTTLSLSPFHHPYDDDVIKSRRITESSNETEKDQDADDPLSNKLFYLGGKRSPRLRQDPEWTSISDFRMVG